MDLTTAILNTRYNEVKAPAIARRKYAWGTLELRARWDASEYDIEYRTDEDEPWRELPINVAAAGHSQSKAFALANQWLASQNPSR